MSTKELKGYFMKDLAGLSLDEQEEVKNFLSSLKKHPQPENSSKSLKKELGRASIRNLDSKLVKEYQKAMKMA